MSYYKLYCSAIDDEKILVSKKIKKILSISEQYYNGENEKYYFDELKSNRVINFIEQFCKHSKGEFATNYFKLSLWQKVLIEFTFGIVDDKGLRKYNEVFCVVARKNGKSTFASALAIYMLMFDNENGAEIYCVATKKEQARIVFDEITRMISQNRNLSSIITKRRTDLYFEKTYSKCEPISSDAKTLDGLNPHFAILDEVHAMKNREIYDVIKSAFGSRKQQMIFTITTAGTVRESIFDDLYEHSTGILNETINDDRFLPFIYELDEVAEFDDIKMLKKANPNLSISKSTNLLVEEMNKASYSPKDKVNFLTKHCNIRQAGTTSFLNFTDVVACQVAELPYGLLQNSYGVGGVDLSKTTDITSASILIPIEGKIYCLHKSFIPSSKLKSNAEYDNVPYDIWQQAGYIETSGEHNVAYSAIHQWFNEMKNKYNITLFGIAYDNWNAEAFSNEMANDGYTMVIARQGAKTLSEPMKRLEIDMLNHAFQFDNLCLKMGLLNCSVKSDENDNIRPVKDGTIKRIDPAVATINAYTLMLEYSEDFQFITNFKKEQQQ